MNKTISLSLSLLCLGHLPVHVEARGSTLGVFSITHYLTFETGLSLTLEFSALARLVGQCVPGSTCL